VGGDFRDVLGVVLAAARSAPLEEGFLGHSATQGGPLTLLQVGTHVLFPRELLALGDVGGGHVAGPHGEALEVVLGVPAQGGLVGVEIVEFEARGGGGREREGVGGRGGAEDEAAARLDVVEGLPPKRRAEIVLAHVIIYLMIALGKRAQLLERGNCLHHPPKRIRSLTGAEHQGKDMDIGG
jgi:hypothetical protein